MKFTTLILFLMAIVAFAGCEAQNPVCTENFCFVGEAFPRSELEAGQEFSEVDIDDSVIFATLIGTPTPVETTPIPQQPTQPAIAETPQINNVLFADIVSDVASGGTKYLDKTVKITAPVFAILESGVALASPDESVNFYVKSPDNPAKLAQFQNGKTYRFTVEIYQIAPPNLDYDTYAVFSDLDTNADIKKIDPIRVGVKKVVDDVVSGGTKYIAKTVKVTANVAFSAENGISFTTNNASVSWVVISHNKDLDFRRYRENQSYTFTILIWKVVPPDVSRDYYRIDSIFIEAD